MRLHPMIVYMHIMETTAAASRGRRRNRSGLRAFFAGAAVTVVALAYFAARAAA